ncbi:hypothetical protein Q9X96_003093 [Vibrio vulnificus]|nr:hypothetical protein [Vibrio vulnificus]
MGLEIGTIAAIISAASAVVSLAMTLSMDQPEAKDNGSAIDRKGQDNPKVVPFGRCIVPATRVWNNVNNSNVSQLAQAYSFGVGPIKSFEQVYIDGVNYFRDGVQPVVDNWYESSPSGEFPNVAAGLRLGRLVEANAYDKMVQNGDGEWTANHKGHRTPSLSLLATRMINEDGDNNVRFISDRVSVEALVHGNAVIDPRFDLGLEGIADVSKRTWQNAGRDSYRNPACVMFTYLVDKYYGLGVPHDAIDANSFIELANYCDEQNYTFDGYIDQGSDYAQILVDMCSAFDGMIYIEEGMIKVKADAAAPVVASITTDHIVDGFKLSNTNDSNYYNVVNCEFINRDATNTKDKYVLPSNVMTDETINSDGFEKAKDFKFLYTVDSGSFELIKKLANRKLKKAKYQQNIEFGLDNTLVSVNLHDVIEVTHADYGLNKKKFRVTKIETTLDEKTMISKVSATEYNDSVYDDSDYDDGITSPPIKPPTNIILSPANLTFTQNSFTTSGSGVLKWNTRYFKEHKTVVEYKLSSATSWKRLNEVQTSKYELTNLRADNYDFRVMTRDFFGNTSEWTTIFNQAVQGGIGMPNVSGLKGIFDSKDLTLSWDDVKSIPLDVPDSENFDGVSTVGDVFSHYEVIINKGATSVYKETVKTATNNLVYTFDQNVNTGINRNIEVVVYTVAKDGSKSLVGTKLRKINTQVTQPTGLKIESILSNVVVSWNQPSDKDFYATDIHISNDAEFVPSANTLVHTTTVNSYSVTKTYTGIQYVKVVHYDAFGKDGLAYSPVMSFTQKTIDDLLEEAPSFVEVDQSIKDINTDIANIDSDITQIDRDIAAVGGRVDAAVADIVENAKNITTVNSTLGNHQSQINSNKTLINGVSANLASLEQSVSAEFEDTKAAIQSNQTAIAGVDEALTEYKTTVAAEFNGVKSSIQSNQTAIANANEAITALDTKLSSEIDGVASNVSNNYYTKTQTDGKVSSAVSALKTELSSSIDGVDDKVDAANANLSNNYYTKTQTDGKVTSATSALETKLNSSIAGVDDKVDAANSNLSQNYYTKTVTDGKISTATSALETKLNSSIAGVDDKVDAANANLSNNYYTKTQTDGKVSSAIAASESKLTANVAGQYATISTVNQVKVTADGAATAVSQLTQDVNGKTSGIIMVNDGNVSKTAVISDKFMVCTDATGTNKSAVFQVVNGQTVIKDALIGNLSASKITAGVMSGDRISATSKLFVGSGNASATLSGADATWRIAAGHSTMGSAPFRVDKNGKMYATNADITGHINATSGTFNGHIIAQSIELPAGTIPDTYTGQNQTQIWGGGYNEDNTKGWGIHSNGYAEFLGGLNTKNATIEGAMIIGATIYSGESLYSIDFNADGVTDDVRYISKPEIPLGARPSYSANTSASLAGHRDMMSTAGTFNVLSCTERRGDPNSNRFRWGKIRAGAMSVRSTAGYINQLTTIWGGTVGAKFTITLYAPDGSVVERSPVKTISRVLSGYYNGTETAIVTVAGVSFDVSFRYKMDVERDHDHKPTGAYWAELGGFSVSNRAGTFGSLTDNAKNGYFGVEVQCGLLAGKSNGWTGDNRGVAYQLTVNNSDLPA